MSRYSAIKAATNAYIKTNGRQEITGAILNAVMIATIDSLGKFYQFVGNATPDTNPGVIDQNIAYLASTPGTYTNLGGFTIPAGEFAIIKFDGEWKKEVVVVIPTKVSELINDAGYITRAVSDLINYYTKDEMDTALADIFTKDEVREILEDYYDRDEVDSIVSAITQQSYVVAWDGTAEPVVADIPAGVSVTWGGNPYMGTLAASASTINKIYLVSNGAGYDEYVTTDNSGYAWIQIGTTSLDLSGYALSRDITTRATSVNDADYAVRAVTSSYSLVDDPNGTRVRIVFPVKEGDTIRISTTYYSGITAGIWNSPANCVYAGSPGRLQELANAYTTDPVEAVSDYDAYLGVSFTNGNTAIDDDMLQAMLDSLTIFVGGDVKADLNAIQTEQAKQNADISELKGDVYADPLSINTTTDNIAVTAYSDKTSGPLEDTLQVMPAGAKLTKVKMFSTGSTNSNGKTHLIIYDENRTKVGDYTLGNIGATDTEFDVSAYNIIIKSGYHYAVDRMGNKYTTAIPDGRFKVAPTGANATSKYFYGWTFTYEVKQTKLDELKADYPEVFNRKVVVDNPLYDTTYSGYNNGNALEDKWQDLPVGAKLTKVHLGSTGSTGGNPSYLYIYDDQLAQVGSRIKLGTIGTTATTFDISSLDIVVQSGYHYCIQYFPRISAGNNINSGRYFVPATQTNPLSTYQVGFSFSYEYERTGADTIPETSLKGKYGSFIGDSICEGAGYKGGYALLVARKYGMKPPQNLGSSGAIIATNTNENRVYINTMVSKVDPNADFVIIQGGSNDASISTPMGAITEGFTAELDVTTYYGAFENLCKTLVTQCAGKKIGYIARHRNSPTDKYSYTWLPKETNYYDPAIAVCEKWGVPYLDLNRHCPPLGCISSLREAYTANGDGSHPNEDGYNKYYVDRIAAWMETL